MKTFIEWENEYNNLIERRKSVKQELYEIQTNLVLELLQKEYNELNEKIKNFEKMKLYTVYEYENANKGW